MSLQDHLKVGSILSPLTVETLVNGGAGLARHEGRVVFIPHVAINDIVSCRVTKVKKHFLEAEIGEILQSAPERRQPICPVAGDCGGCQWQHLPYPEQLRWKERLFRESLIRQGKVDPARILSIVPAANEWNYRSRVQVKCSNSKTGFVTGFYRSKSHFVVPIEQCPIIASELNTLLSHLRKIINHTAYASDIPQIDLAIDDSGKCQAVIHYSGHNLSSLVDLLKAENLAVDLLVKSGSKRKLTNIRGDGVLQLTVDQPSLKLRYAAGSFAQINLEQNRNLVNMVIDLAKLTGDEQGLDLYCGMGNFSLPLAKRSRQVVGIEESAVSIRMARENGWLNQVDNVEFYSQSAEGALSHFTQQNTVDLLFLDPPRSGATSVMKELLKTPVSKVIYVSCDPQTLARDLNLLVNGGYEVVSSQPLDMFPQTHHCESVTLLQYVS
ncbi:MAG: 23S rRNA (uracil(1939)-C(5))-methyltransferase RlmD [Thermodesulfobacteriota bacterium]|nr:23S rRNA (uracil(1939)-C(5))-methyltransferase RlmD [Thermodesulfobacteriota bacterium]